MADPEVLDLTADTWTKVATNQTSGVIHVMITQSNVQIYQTYRATGGTAPTAAPGAATSGAVLLDLPKEDISASAGIDVYIYPKGGTAKLRIDL